MLSCTNWCTGISSRAVTPSRVRCCDDRGVREAGVGAAEVLGHVGMQLGEALDVGLVDEGLVVRHVGPAVALPVEERVDDDAEHHVRCRSRRRSASRGRRSRSRTTTGPSRCRRRSPSRRGRGAACAGCTAGPAPGRRCRGRGSRTAARAGPTAGSSARRTRRPRSVGTRVSLRSSSNRHSSTRSATSLKTAKLVPTPSNVAPKGYAAPGQTSIDDPSRSSRAPDTSNPTTPPSAHRRVDPRTVVPAGCATGCADGARVRSPGAG